MSVLRLQFQLLCSLLVSDIRHRPTETALGCRDTRYTASFTLLSSSECLKMFAPSSNWHFFFPPAIRRSLTITAFIVIPRASVAYLADFIFISPAHWLLWHFVTGSQIFAYTIGGQLCVCSLCYSKHDILIKGLVGLLNSDRWNLNSISIL